MESTSLVRRNHIKLLSRFIKGGGTEFMPLKDPIGNRRPFLDHLIRANEVEVRLSHFSKMMIDDGRFLLYLQPNGRSYRFHAYSKDQYQVDRNADGEIESVCVVYSYKQKVKGMPAPRDRWIKLYITGAAIWHQDTDFKPEFEQDLPPDLAPVPNVFGFVPCVEVLNPTVGKRGESDFADLEPHIEAHDIMSEAILDNLQFFCQSPIVTSRDANEVEDHLYDTPGRNERNSVSYASGFRRVDAKNYKPRKRLKRILGGFEEGDMVQQLQINPVPDDLIQYTDRYESQLRTALGGVDENGIETATETRILYGGVEVEAREKREALYTYGLCKLLEMAITAEEAIWLESGGEFGLQPAFDQESGQSVDRAVVYRTAPVFVPTTRDVLDRSIVGRNLQRLGVDVKETLRQVYPDKSDDELLMMVGKAGLPVEYLQDVMSVMQTLLGLVDPVTGGPIADPNTGLPMAYSLIPLITEALNYGDQFKQPYAFTDPRTQRDEQRSLAAAATRILLERSLATTGEQSDPVVSANDRATLGLSQPLPTPGSTVAAKRNPFFDLSRSPILNAIGGLFGGN